MDPIPQIDERLRKLLLLVGQQGPVFQLRDISHISISVSSLFSKHLLISTQLTPLISLITKCIVSVPGKQHLYALMTGELTKQYEQNMGELINCVLLELQASMNTFKEVNVNNIILYLAELMNYDMLNSSVFLSLIESMVNETRKVGKEEREFYLRVIVGVVPYCWKNLERKMGGEWRKVMDRIDREREGLDREMGEVWGLIWKGYEEGGLEDYSGKDRLERSRQEEMKKEKDIQNNQDMSKLQEKPLFKQFSPTFKLSFKDRSSAPSLSSTLPFTFTDPDPTYLSYHSTLPCHLSRLSFLTTLSTYFTLKSTLIQKLLKPLTLTPTPYLPKLLIQTLYHQLFITPQHDSIIISSLFISIASEPESDIKSQLVRGIEETALWVFREAERMERGHVERFVDVVSHYCGNIVKGWDWGKWVEMQREGGVVNRGVILRLVFEKIAMISDFKPSEDIQPYISPKYTPPLLDSTQSLFQSKLLSLLSSKSQSPVIISFLSTPSQFTIFLNLLLTRMSPSNTHLTKLCQRYLPVFQHFKFDRQTVTGIFDFWQHSEYHKEQYFVRFLKEGMVGWEKFVEGVSMRGKLSGGVEKVMLRRVYERVKAKVFREGEVVEMEEGLREDLEQSLAL